MNTYGAIAKAAPTKAEACASPFLSLTGRLGIPSANIGGIAKW